MKRAAQAFARQACSSLTLHVLGTSPKEGRALLLTILISYECRKEFS